MSKLVEKELCVGLDIGTHKIVAIVAEVDADGGIEIIGVGRCPSDGMKKGLVVDVGKLSEAIEEAVREAENMADCEIHTVFAGISGSHVVSISSHGLAAASRREITKEDVNRAVYLARQYSFPTECELLHAIPRSFTLDDMGGIRQPIGMTGSRLQADVHLIGCSVTALLNVRNCLSRCSINAEMMILEPLATAEATLSDDESKLGVCVVDIGGGTTDIAVFTEGSIQHTHVIPIAGDHVTSDVTINLRTPTASAEQLKRDYGTAMATGIDADEKIEVPDVGERPPRTISRHLLAKVIQSRYEELFGLVRNELERNKFDGQNLVSGVVLTGGGSQMKGARRLAEEVFQMPVRRGTPHGVQGFEDMLASPTYATGVGLLRYGVRHQGEIRRPTSWWRSVWNGIASRF